MYEMGEQLERVILAGVQTMSLMIPYNLYMN